MSKPFFPPVEPDGNPEHSKDRPSDWLRLIAIWSWLRCRPSATFDEFLAAITDIDRFSRSGQDAK